MSHSHKYYIGIFLLILVKGCVKVKVLYQGHPLLVVENNGSTLLGRDWLKEIHLNWRSIHHVASSGLEELLNKYQSVFREELGTLYGFQAHIEVEPGAQPQFCKMRTAPYALQGMVEEILKKTGRGRHTRAYTVFTLGYTDSPHAQK